MRNNEEYYSGRGTLDEAVVFRRLLYGVETETRVRQTEGGATKGGFQRQLALQQTQKIYLLKLCIACDHQILQKKIIKPNYSSML